MINHFNVDSNTWTQITQAGQSGVCWLTMNGVIGEGNCVIFHTSGTPTENDIVYAYPVFEPKGQNKHELISADSDSDVYYAIVDNNGTCTIVVDVI